VGHLLTAMPWACDVRGGRKRHGQALEQSKKGCHKVDFDNNKRTDQTEFIPGADNEFDMLIAKVRAAVDKVLPSSMPSLSLTFTCTYICCPCFVSRARRFSQSPHADSPPVALLTVTIPFIVQGRAAGDQAVSIYEQHFQVKLRT
jgi:hypothetical protein